MSKIILILLIFILPGSLLAQKSIYSYTVKDINGKDFPMSKLKGKKIMIVNVASKCGFTPQYKELERIYKKYKKDNFIIIGFPANNFKAQEPGTNKEIKKFCTLNYGVDFPMMAKISVKGQNMADIYKWLTEKKLNGKKNSEVKWNFQKYLIGTDGKIDFVINPWVKPDNKKIIKWITGMK